MACTLVIFGASGDLTSRKLIPSLYQLFRKKRLPEQTRIVGFSRTRYSDQQWRDALGETTAKYQGKDFDAAAWQEFAKIVHFQPGDIGEPQSFEGLHQRLHELEGDGKVTRVYYLATAAQFYEEAVERLGGSNLADEINGPRRIVIEKPFGSDEATAERLNIAVHKVFKERQVYRIDHYLGKETVQNILVLRFANTIFEPVWNRNYVDHVQITVAEEVAVGRRGAFYDEADRCRSAARRGSEDLAWKEIDPNLPKSPWWYTEEPALGVGMRLVRPLAPPDRSERLRWGDADIESIRADASDRLMQGRGSRGIVDPQLPAELKAKGIGN